MNAHLRPRRAALKRYGPWSMLLVVLAVSLVYAITWNSNGLFLDMLYYFNQYQLQVEEGYLTSMLAGVTISGKFEVGIYQVYVPLAMMGVSSSFWFLFWMFVILQGAILVAVLQHVPPRFSALTLTLILLSHFSTSQNFYFWRQVLAVAIAVTACKQPRRLIKVPLFALACAFHYSAISLPILFYIAQRTKQWSTQSVCIAAFATFVFAHFARSFVTIFTATEQDVVLFQSTSYVLFIVASVLGALLVFIWCHSWTRDEGTRVLATMCILLCGIALAGGSSNLFIIRAFTPASLLLPYMAACLPRRYAVPVLLVTCVPAVSILIKINLLSQQVGDF